MHALSWNSVVPWYILVKGSATYLIFFYLMKIQGLFLEIHIVSM